MSQALYNDRLLFFEKNYSATIDLLFPDEDLSKDITDILSSDYYYDKELNIFIIPLKRYNEYKVIAKKFTYLYLVIKYLKETDCIDDNTRDDIVEQLSNYDGEIFLETISYEAVVDILYNFYDNIPDEIIVDVLLKAISDEFTNKINISGAKLDVVDVETIKRIIDKRKRLIENIGDIGYIDDLNLKCGILIKTKDFLIIRPLSFESFESLAFSNSFRYGGEGIRWYGDKNDLREAWENYLEDGTRFYFIYFINKNIFFGIKIMIEYNVKEDFVITWSQEDGEIDSGILAIYLNNYYTIFEFENDKQLCLDFENILLKNKKNEYLIDLIQKLTEDNNKEEREWEEWEKY
jgi:hypothetical protein